MKELDTNINKDKQSKKGVGWEYKEEHKKTNNGKMKFSFGASLTSEA